jgi:tetratricopeptide (TPR) repeat protein
VKSGRAGAKMHDIAGTVEQLRQQALTCARAEKYDEALALYDRAIAVVTDDETRELLTINKADAMIASGRTGAEVQSLPTILMRRRNLHHTFLAAYALMFLHRTENNIRRAIVFGETALRAAIEANEPFWKLAALNDLGICYEIDSQFPRAIECLEEAMGLTALIEGETERKFSETAILQNLGYNKLLVGETLEGLAMIHRVIEAVEVPSSLSDSYIDLCYGYLELKEFAKAREYGEIGLQHAVEPRQVRNAHYLLGEAAYECGDIDSAEYHFDELTKFYPQFRNLKHLLFAIDLRGMVNLRL